MKLRYKLLTTCIFAISNLLFCVLSVGYSQESLMGGTSFDDKLWAGNINKAFHQLNDNSIFSLTVRYWTIEANDSKGKLKTLSALISSEEQGQPCNSVEESSLQASGFSKKVVELLGEVDALKWKFSSFEGIRKFELTYDTKTEQKWKNDKVDFSPKTEWLFSDTSVYTLNTNPSVVRIRPVDPFTDAYPLSISSLNLFWSIKDIAAFVPALRLQEKEGNQISAFIGKKNTQRLVMSVNNNNLIISEFKYLPENQKIQIERYYLNQWISPSLAGVGLPFSVVEMLTTNGTTKIMLATFSSVDFGHVTKDEIAIVIPPGTPVEDVSANVPIKQK